MTTTLQPTIPFPKSHQEWIKRDRDNFLEHCQVSKATVLRIPRIINGGKDHTNKPDGMFIRDDGLCTDHRQHAALFYDGIVLSATIRHLRENGCTLPIFPVDVETQVSIKALGKVWKPVTE